MSDATAEFMALANRAADDHVRGGTPLDSAIAKIAEEKELSRVQIQRVVEFANHETNERLRKQAEDKTFRFDLASVDGVMGHLDSGDGHRKVAAFRVSSAMAGYAGREGMQEHLDKLAESAYEHPIMAQIRVRKALDAMEKVAARINLYHRRISARQAGLHESIRDELGKLAAYARNHVSAGNRFSDLHKLACNYDRKNGRTWDVVFGRVRDGLLKTASASPMVAALRRDSLTPSDEIPVEVVNGNHKLLIGLDTLRNKISEEDRCAKRIRLMDTLGPAVVEYVKSLRSSSDVAKHVHEDIEKVAEAAGTEDGFFAEAEKLAGIVKSVSKDPKKWAKRGLVAAGVGAVGLGGVAAYKGLKGSGEAMAEGRRDWRPGAYRGVGDGGEAV